jgi:hypothetical protein
LRAAFHHDLQIAREAKMGGVRIRGYFRIDESASHDIRHVVYERVVNAAVRYMNHAMRAQFKQPELGCA